jgi:hypothetical protein
VGDAIDLHDVLRYRSSDERFPSSRRAMISS